MNKAMLQELQKSMKEIGVCEYAFLRQSDIMYSVRLRDNCEMFCPNFNTNWSCPPNTGSIDENIAKCQRYQYGLLVSGYPLLDEELIQNSNEPLFVLSRRHMNARYLELGKQLEAMSGNPALILRTFCVLCKKCAYPEPCRFPEKSSRSVESHGIQMVSMMEKLHFTRFSNERGYTCICLILFNTDEPLDLEYGKRVALKEYPPFVEAQEYVDSLYKSGEISTPADLTECKSLAPGCYPMNGAGPDSVCVLTCNSDITMPLMATEIEASGMPVNVLVMDTHHHSAMHAYTEGIMTAHNVCMFIRSLQAELQPGTLIIPQPVFMIQYPLSRALPGWNVKVGAARMADFKEHLLEILNQ